ncbi:MAG TPA: asparagine synthase (glutamine-hydrolyzing) [Pyrinomonadaceae bacterium]|nr:asparagine synthase (glutamine-hydrolyzing) [Pyrinomonadaceae bacterium]
MCGICGVWGAGDNREAVGAMVAAMHHRGPDDSGVTRDGPAALGMTRLAILDTSAGGHQPMSTPDGLISVVYNGELYNFREERRLLEAKGYSFHSTSDTEVLLRMYEHYGDDFLLRMRGMFALAVYDKRRGPGRERLLLARDQMGIKPLLYARAGGRLVFASEVKAMLASGLVAPEVDPAALRLLLTYGSVYQPRTILRGVSMLLPAHRMIVEGGRERVERYWSLGLDRREGLRRRPYEELVEEMASVLEESVRLQMVSDVPLGAFLSGGVDSSLLVALMARQAGGRVKTFSVGFGAEGSAIDETGDAERTARHIGTDHSRVLVTGEEVRARIGHIAYGLDQPTVDGVNSYFVSLAARRAVTVAISGTGGDELFAGYPWFAQMALDASARGGGAAWKALAKAALAPAVHRAILDPLPPGRLRSQVERLRYATDFRTRYAETYKIFGAQGAARVLAPALRGAAQAGHSPRLDFGPADELPRGTAIERVTGVCLRGYTTNQLLRDIDAVSMAHSLEVRVPYLDPVVADAALSLPDEAKLGSLPPPSGWEPRSYREAGTKRVLLDVAKPLLPEGYDTQVKRGFAMPFDDWLRGPLREVMLDSLSEGAVRARGLLDPAGVAAVRDEFAGGASDWTRPWLLMMIELWSREVLDVSPRSLARGARGALDGAREAARHDAA